MPWTTPETFTAGQTLTAASMNALSNNIKALNGERTSSAAVPSCEVRLSGDVNPYTTGAAISWAAEEYDTDSMWSSGDATKVFTTTPGVYLVSFSGRTLQASGSVLTVGAPTIKLNGSTVSQGYFRALSSGGCIYVISAIVRTTAATDYFTFSVEHEGGTTYLINGGTTRNGSNNRALVAWLGASS